MLPIFNFRKQWKTGENITPEKANAYISAPIQNIYDMNTQTVRVVTASNPLTVSAGGTTVFYPFARPMIARLNLRDNETVRLSVSGSYNLVRTSGTATNIISRFDVLIDNDYYLSSMDASALTDGVMTIRKLTTNHDSLINFSFLVVGFSEGLHSFELVASSGNATFDLSLNIGTQFKAEGYGTNIGQLIAGNAT